jgi:hypothetical protein
MPTSRHPLALALALAAGIFSSGNAPADVDPSPPRNIAIYNLAAFPDMVFVLTWNKADGPAGLDAGRAPGIRLDPSDAERRAGVQLPRDLPEGEISLLAVPRELAKRSKEPVDPAWLGPTPAKGVILVKGSIHTYPVEKHSALHRYQVDQTDKGLTLTLLNPDVLQPYPPERFGEPDQKTRKDYLSLIAAVGALVLAAAGWLVWRPKRQHSSAGTGA